MEDWSAYSFVERGKTVKASDFETDPEKLDKKAGDQFDAALAAARPVVKALDADVKVSVSGIVGTTEEEPPNQIVVHVQERPRPE